MLIAKFLGKGFPLQIVKRELRLQRWLRRDFQTIPSFEVFWIFQFETEKDKTWVWNDGPWIVVEHILGIDDWRPDFKANENVIQRATIGIRILALLLGILWNKDSNWYRL